MYFVTSVLNGMLDDLDVRATHVSLHTADPGSTGAAEVGSLPYLRQPLTWAAASGGQKLASPVTFQVPASMTITHFGFWNSASGGVFAGGAPLDGPETFLVDGPYVFTPMASTDAISALPLSGGQLTGSLELVSSPDGGYDTYDSTSRLLLHSYQTGGNNNFGEVVRIFLHPQPDDVVLNRSKAMITWELPDPLTSDDPADFNAITWIGAHYGAQNADDPTDVHGHFSIETPDSIGHLQTRFALSLVDEAGNLGADKTLITTSSADMVIGCDSGQVLRLKAGASTSAQVEVAKTVWGGTSKRWRFGGDGATESGSNAGTDWRLQRYSDTGGDIDTPIRVIRSSGRTVIGGDNGTASGLDVRRAGGGTALVVDTYIGGTGATGITGYQHLSRDATSIAVSTRVAAESIDRFRAYADGKLEWGTGSSGRDTTLYRSAADLLKTDDSFHAAHLYATGRALGVPTPADHGLTAWSQDPAGVTTSQVTVNGTLYLTAVYVPRAMTITKIVWGVGTVGATPVAGQNWVGLYSSAGAKVAEVAVDGRISASGVYSETVSAAVTPGLYWVAMMFNATTPPSVLRTANQSAALVNASLTAATARFATNGTALTALPATITPASNTMTATSWFVAVG